MRIEIKTQHEIMHEPFSNIKAVIVALRRKIMAKNLGLGRWKY